MRFRAGANLVLLDPDVAAAFPTDEAVKDALRVLLSAATAMSKVRTSTNKSARRSAPASKVSDRPAAHAPAPKPRRAR